MTKTRYAVLAIILAGLLGAGITWYVAQSQVKGIQATRVKEIAERDKRIADLERTAEEQRQQIQSLTGQISYLNEHPREVAIAGARALVAASKGKLTSLATALESYFVDHGQYPNSLGDLIPDYIKEYVIDPCTNSPYKYQPLGALLIASPTKDYRLTISFPASTPCASITRGLSYTPGSGLQEMR
jgi:hypothetical protein